MKGLCIILSALLSLPVLAEDSVVIGRATAHFPIEAEAPCPPPDEHGEYICMDAWIGFKISVTKTIAGPEVSGAVKAARVQHTQYVRSYRKRLKLFVLRPIPTEELRHTLGADYLLLEATTERRVYCFSQSPSTYALKDQVSLLETGSKSEYCFELEEGRR
jgi:hypothetical protein